MLYSPEFLDSVCKRLQSTDPEELEKFSKLIVYLGEQYLFLKLINPQNSEAAKQKKLLKQYYTSLKKTKKLYDRINKDNFCESALSISLRTEYNKLSADIKSKISAYIAEGRYEELFANSLELHLKASEIAPNIICMKYSSRNILMQWLVAYKINWTQKSQVQFTLGDYLTENNGYKSKSCDILHEILSKIDPTHTRTYVANLMREIIENDIIQAPAYIF